MKTPFPWFSASRSGGGWFVKFGGEQNFLGKHPDDGSKPKRGRDGRWNPPTVILDEFYILMALRDTASKSDYALETVCALYLMELAETNPDLSKRCKQTLGHLCDFEYRGKKVGNLLVNAELEGIHLRRWAAPSRTPGRVDLARGTCHVGYAEGETAAPILAAAGGVGMYVRVESKNDLSGVAQVRIVKPEEAA